MYLFRAILKEDRKSKKPIDIIDYKIQKTNVQFTDSEKNKYKLEDFYYFMITPDELKGFSGIKDEVIEVADEKTEADE